MAHELDMSNDRANMAYVGDKPWHGLGQELTEGASIEEWTQAAGLNWSANLSPVTFKTDSGIDIEMPNRQVIYRSDTQAPLSVVSDRYKPVQPEQVMEFFRDLTEGSHAQMETAGSLHGGKIIWALARLGDNLKVLDDEIAPFLMLSTSFDMSTPTIAKMVATRVVCNNTIQVALKEDGRREYRIPHSTIFNDADVRAGLEISLTEFERFQQQATKLARQQMTLSEMDAYLIKLFQPEKGEIEGDVIRKSKHYAKIISLFSGDQLGAEQQATKGTAWGALNAITQYVDHDKGRDQSWRLQDAWFGLGGKLKERALELLAA